MQGKAKKTPSRPPEEPRPQQRSLPTPGPHEGTLPGNARRQRELLTDAPTAPPATTVQRVIIEERGGDPMSEEEIDDALAMTDLTEDEKAWVKQRMSWQSRHVLSTLIDRAPKHTTKKKPEKRRRSEKEDAPKKKRRKNKKKKEPELTGYTSEDVESSSDEDLEESEFAPLSKKRAPKGSEMFVDVTDGRLFGRQLLKIVDTTVKEFIEDPTHRTLADEEIKKLKEHHIVGGSDWITYAGALARQVPSTEYRPFHEGIELSGGFAQRLVPEKKIQIPGTEEYEARPGELFVGAKRTKLTTELRGTMSRLLLGTGNLTDEEVQEKLATIKRTSKLSGSQIAQSLLDLLRMGAVEDEEVGSKLSKKDIDFLSFVNTLFAGVEGSRLNTSYFFYPSLLERVAKGKGSVEEIFFLGDFGGRHPMATVGQKGSKGALGTRRKDLLESSGGGTLRFSKRGSRKKSTKTKEIVKSPKPLRKQPQQNAVVLKELLEVTEIAKELRDEDDTQASLEGKLEQYVENRLAEYYPLRKTEEEM